MALLSASVVGHVVAVAAALFALFVVGEDFRPAFFLLYLPRHPFVALGLLLLPLALLARRRTLIGLEVVALLCALFPLMGLRLGISRAPRGKPLRLLTYNVFYAKLDNSTLVNDIVGANADVVVLQAGRSGFAATLQGRLPGWTVRADDEFILATKLAVATVEVPERFDETLSQSWVRYDLDGPTGPFRVVNVHPVSARAGLFDREDPRIANALRERQIRAAVAAAGGAPGPVLVAGDTNLPGASAIRRRTLSGLTDAFDQVGFGFGYTFPAKLPWMRIDRVLAGPGVSFLDIRVLPRGASDHRAVIVDFEIARP